MKCIDYQQLISNLLDEQISSTDEQTLKSHLKDCSNCMDFYSQAKKVDEQIKFAEVPKFKKPVINYTKKKPFARVAMAGSSIISLLLVAVLISPLLFNGANEVAYKGAVKCPENGTSKLCDNCHGLNAGNPEKLNEPKKDAATTEEYSDSGSNALTGGSATMPSKGLKGLAIPPTKKVRKNKTMLVRNKNLTLDVIVVNSAYQQIDTLVKNAGGYMESTRFNRNNSGNSLSGYLKTKIPNENFEDTYAKIKKLGLVKATDENSEDITLDYIDNVARLKNLTLQEKRYQSLIDKANTINDMLSIEQNLSDVRGQIEEIKAEINYQKKTTSYVTLAITLQKKASKIKWSFTDYIKQAIQNAADATGFILKTIGALLPIIILILVITYIYKRFIKK